jgi:hypothetical protein
MQRAGREIDCELLSIAAGSWDCIVSDDDWVISNRRFACRAAAVAYAEEQRKALLIAGWR